ncbi:hypothetical protein V8E54_009743 [Elaphomyces granulatus]
MWLRFSVLSFDETGIGTALPKVGITDYDSNLKVALNENHPESSSPPGVVDIDDEDCADAPRLRDPVRARGREDLKWDGPMVTPEPPSSISAISPLGIAMPIPETRYLLRVQSACRLAERGGLLVQSVKPIIIKHATDENGVFSRGWRDPTSIERAALADATHRVEPRLLLPHVVDVGYPRTDEQLQSRDLGSSTMPRTNRPLKQHPEMEEKLLEAQRIGLQTDRHLQILPAPNLLLHPLYWLVLFAGSALRPMSRAKGQVLQELEDRVEGRLQQFEAVEPRKENGVDCILQAASRSSDDVLLVAPAPPYNRTPIQVQDETMELIRRSDSMTLTAGTIYPQTHDLWDNSKNSTESITHVYLEGQGPPYPRLPATLFKQWLCFLLSSEG